MSNYDDIINLEHYEPKNHIRMSMESRAAQFSPFAALTGYNDAVREKARITDIKRELDEEKYKKINDNLNIIRDNIINKPKIKILYFLKDEYKNGGKYINYIGNVRRIDDINRKILFIDGLNIDFDNIMDIDLIDN